MKIDRSSSRVLLLIAIACVALVACQSSNDPDPVESGPILAFAPFSVSDSSRLPDSAYWDSQSGSGVGRLYCNNLSCTDTISLKDALGADAINLRLWALGIRIGTLHFLQSERSPYLVLQMNAERDSLDLRLLDSFANLRKVKTDSFAKLGKIGPANLVQFYADLLLAKDTAFNGFPSNLPVGMRPDSVKSEIVQRHIRTGKTWKQLVALKLDLDSGAIQKLSDDLLKAGKISGADIQALFPPYPVQVLSSLSVAGNLAIGGDPVTISGAFSWTKGKVVSPAIMVRTIKGADALNFSISQQSYPSSGDTVWNLSNNLTIQARPTADTGTDTLVITLSSDSGYVAVARTAFRVVRRDTTPPVLRITSPMHDTTVANNVASIVVVATASDSGSGIESVRIGGLSHVTQPFADTLLLGIGANQIVVQATDKAGNKSTSSVVVTRRASPGDTTAPKIVRDVALNDTAVGWSTKVLSLSWTVTDDSLLSKVTINDSVLTSLTSTFRKLVGLKVGIDTFVLLALDARGNPKRDTIRITRLPDVVPPLLWITAPSKGATVANSVENILVVADATDSSGIDSIKIGNSKHIAAPCSDSVALFTGVNLIVVQAWDKAGNRTVDTVRVIRERSSADTMAPTIRREGPAHDTTVAWASNSISLVWKITDDSLLSKVTLNDSVMNSNTSHFQKLVSLGVGTNTFVVLALDAHGNASHDTLRITRLADTSKPLVTRGSSTRDTVLSKNQSTLAVSWTVIDKSIQSVSINGLPVAGNANTYSSVVPLSGDSLWIVMVAKGASGNSARDSVKIWRLGTPSISPHGAALSGSQDTTATISSNLLGANVLYSTDKQNWVAGTAIPISTSQILYAQAAFGSATSGIDSAIFLYTPTINLPSGAYTSGQSVSITAVGSPTVEDSLSSGSGWNSYNGPISVSSSVRIFARSRLGWVVSSIADANYTFDTVKALIFDPAPGPYTTIQNVSITSATPGASIYYTTDGTLPTPASTLYSGAIPVGITTTIKAITTKAGFVSGKVVTTSYTFDTAAPPTFTPVGGAYTAAENVILTSATPGSRIYYTTDGSLPTKAATPYINGITLKTSQTIKAITTKDRMVSSSVVTARYTFDTAAPPVFNPLGGAYIGAQVIKISCTTPGVQIYYTTDGTMPSTTSLRYSDSINVNVTDTIRAVAFKNGMVSNVGRAIYHIYGALTDVRDGKLYPTITIGSQTWMASNLDFRNLIGGKDSVGVCYQLSNDSCAKYGRLYSWAESMEGEGSSTAIPSGVKGVCPIGWHLPSDSEWAILIKEVGDGNVLKSTSGWLFSTFYGDTNGPDSYGFRALPSGIGFQGSDFYNSGSSSNWWSATQFDSLHSWSGIIRSVNANGYRTSDYLKGYNFSVRCLQN